MLQKTVYSQVIQGLKRIRKNWDEDRVENPSSVPYEVDNDVKRLIERCMREGKMQRDPELVEDTVEYLVGKGLLVKSPYGGTMFPLPKDAAPLPTKEELVRQVGQRINKVLNK